MTETTTYYEVQARYWNGPVMMAVERTWKPWVENIETLEQAQRTLANGLKTYGLDGEEERNDGWSALRITRVTKTVEVVT